MIPIACCIFFISFLRHSPTHVPEGNLVYQYMYHPSGKLYSLVSDPSGSARVDMLTGPVAAARAVVATGAWVKSKHDMYLIRASVGT